MKSEIAPQISVKFSSIKSVPWLILKELHVSSGLPHVQRISCRTSIMVAFDSTVDRFRNCFVCTDKKVAGASNINMCSTEFWNRLRSRIKFTEFPLLFLFIYFFEKGNQKHAVILSQVTQSLGLPFRVSTSRVIFITSSGMFENLRKESWS
jgi:hypothetical protein